MLLFSLNVFGQVVNPETKKLPEFTLETNQFGYVENIETRVVAFTSASFLYVRKDHLLAGCRYFFCFDNNTKKWVVFAIHLKKDGVWHYNSKFVHLLKFN